MKKARILAGFLTLCLFVFTACGPGEAAPEWAWEAKPQGGSLYPRALDKQGQLLFLKDGEVSSLSLEALEAEPNHICTLGREDFNLLCVDEAGNYWAANYGGWVCAYSPEGETLYAYSFPVESGISGIAGIFSLPGGGIGCTLTLTVGSLKTYAFSLNMAEPKVLPALNTGAEAYYFAGPTPDGKALLGWNETQVFRLPYTDGQGEFDPAALETLFLWEDSGIVGTSMKILGMPDAEHILARNDQLQQLYSISRIPWAERTEKITLTLAACNYIPDELNRYIADYNARSRRYQIKPVIYDSLTDMNLAVTSGDVPDLFDVTALSAFGDYAEKGVFEDLYPYIEAEGLALVPEALQAHETDGKLYRISPSYHFSTFFGHEDHVGSELGWTWDEVYEALEAAPEGATVFGRNWTRFDACTFLLSQNLSDFVDYARYAADFESADFKRLLQFIKSCPESPDPSMPVYVSGDLYSDLKDGYILACHVPLGGFENYVQLDAMLDGKLVIKGFPSQEKKSAFLFPSSCVSMGSSCKDKAGAWDFIRGLLSEDYPYESWRLPINQALFDQRVEAAKKPQRVEIAPDQWVEYPAMTEAQYGDFMAMFAAADAMLSNEAPLETIILEEAQAYFAGDRSLEETCAIIQNRAQTYVSERQD